MKKYTGICIPTSVAFELDGFISAHSELGVRSRSEAVRRALDFWMRSQHEYQKEVHNENKNEGGEVK